MKLRVALSLILLMILTACGGKTRAPVSERSLSSVQSPSSGQYIVNRGDTLYSIAFRYGLDYRELARINNIGRGYNIYVGQRLKLKQIRTTPTNESIVREASLGAPTTRPQPVQQVQSPSKSVAKQTQPVKSAPKPASKPTSSPVRKPVKTTASGPIRWQWPAQGKVSAYFRTKGNVNKGINIAASKGAPVVAAARGKVVYAGNGLLGYGNLIIIDHNQQFLSAYAHNSRVLVKENDMVKAGERIAEMGSTGTDRVMLHFEIRRDGKPMNPLKYLPKR